jgi:hypothetical protein
VGDISVPSETAPRTIGDRTSDPLLTAAALGTELSSITHIRPCSNPDIQLFAG